MASPPLEDIDDALFPQLGQVLWSWNLCAGCLKGQDCVDDSCPARRVAQLQRYFQFYKAAVSTYVDARPAKDRVLKTYEDLYVAIRELKSKPDISRVGFCQLLSSSGTQNLVAPDSINAATLVVKLLTMIDSSALYQSSDKLETGNFRIHWKDDVPFSKYLQDLFPTGNHSVLSYPGKDLHIGMKSDLRATKLKKHLHITFRATYDIRNHLRLDRKLNVLEIYHHTAFLKEQLRLTKGKGDWSSPSTSIKVGALPRQLVLEVLDSLQDILFDLTDPKSKKLLRSLVPACSFDPDALSFEFSAIRNAGEEKENIPYVYLAERLSELFNEVHNPPPRSWLQRQVERKSSARHMMMATLYGVLFAIFLGFLSLGVSSYQTYIAYQAWKHPVPQPNS